tara:strand:+ start:74972 stop:76156 length:1185 start_codon:yes stop_codon:yes gene_type:complete
MKNLTVAMHGVTGRMGTNQHYIRSILAIMLQGGVKSSSGEVIQIKPILLGRNEAKLKHLADDVAGEHLGQRVDWSTDIDAVVSDPDVDIVFDSSSTQMRASIVRKAADAGKAVYCEKPIAICAKEASELADVCESANVKNGVVQDKLWLPGIRKLRTLRDQGFFGDILGVRGDFGYWVFTGDDPDQTPQRPSWNYRSEDGGGMMVDMFCHWEYLLRDLFGPIDRVLAHATIDIPERRDEACQPYRCTADDSAYAIFVMQDGVTCQFNSSWCTRVRRDDLLTVQVDGTKGSAVAGLRECWTQDLGSTPRPVWNPDVPQPIDFYAGWTQVPDDTKSEYGDSENAFKAQWELFLRHVADDGAFPWTLRRGAAGVALANAGEVSSREQRWVSIDSQAS